MENCFENELGNIGNIGNIENYARQNQSLRQHLTNMISETKSLSKKLPIQAPSLDMSLTKLNIDPEFFDIYLQIVYAMHDFGKLSSVFQQKISRLMDKNIPKIAPECVPFSYHSQLGGIAVWSVLIFLRDKLTIRDGQITLNNLVFDKVSSIDTFLKETIEEMDGSWIYDFNSIVNFENKELIYADILIVIASLAIIMHHNKGLKNELSSFEEAGGYDIEELINANCVDFIKRMKKGSIFDETYTDLISVPWWNFVFANGMKSMLTGVQEDVESFIGCYRSYIENVFDRINQSKSKTQPFFSLLFTYVFSGLCETDEWDAKSYIDNSLLHRISFEQTRINFPYNMIDRYRNLQFRTPSSEYVPTNPTMRSDVLPYIRNLLYAQVSRIMKDQSTQTLRSSIFLIDAPTGSAKTLSLLQAGLQARKIISDTTGYVPRIIYALPFISIVEQVGKQITDIFQQTGILQDTDKLEKYDHNQLLTLHHHLADSKWMALEEEKINTVVLQDETPNTFSYHLINTWHSEIIVTSFVKLFNTVLKGHKREFIRFHRLTGSIILIDEIQGIPAEYWELINTILEGLIKIFGCVIFLASATSPKAILPKNLTIKDIFQLDESTNLLLDRYTLYLDCFDKQFEFIEISLALFADNIKEVITEVPSDSFLIVLNTTRGAYSIYEALTQKFPDQTYILTSKVLPYHRIEVLKEIQARLDKNLRTILICTQIIEAGVDISFQMVYRDFGPLDSIIQVAGRCNRSLEFSKRGEVHLVALNHKEYGSFSALVYQELRTNLTITRALLKNYGKANISEPELRKLSNSYFAQIQKRRITKKLISEFQDAKFGSMNQQFNLISDDHGTIPIVLMLDDNKIEVEYYFKKKNLLHIPNKLRKYTLEINNKELEKIKSELEDHQFKMRKNKFTGDPYYMIRLNNNPKASIIYSKTTGLVMKSLIEKAI